MNIIENRLKRLSRLIGTDPGFYVLALHSFVEFYLREIKKYQADTFPDLTWMFRKELLETRGDEYIDGLNSLSQLGQQHKLTNNVRHAFSEVSEEEARAATHLFVRFCSLAGINQAKQLEFFSRDLETWKEKDSLAEKNLIIRALRDELAGVKKSNAKLSEQIDEYRDLKLQLGELEIKLKTNELEKSKAQLLTERKDEKIDALRRERSLLNEEKNKLLAEREKFIELEKYLDHLARLTVYTRSRMDFERALARLSPEQEEAAGAVKFNRDFLIKGSAGTGKSLVLLELLRRALSQGELAFSDGRPQLFVTYTKTLVNYSRFIASLMKMKIPLEFFSTADSVIYESIKKIIPEAEYDFNIIKRFISLNPHPAVPDTEALEAELDSFIFGFMLTEEEYIKGAVQADTFSTGLDAEKRRSLWAYRSELVSFMEAEKKYSVNYARYRLAALPPGTSVPMYHHIFLDEVQDLNPAALAALKRISTGRLIMSGDFEQALYMSRLPFERAGIEVGKNTRILKMNFRNTRQLLAAALSFRELSGFKSEAVLKVSAFREGPAPEFFEAASETELKKQLIERVRLFLSDLSYESGNICILAQHNGTLDELADFFKSEGLKTDNIKTGSYEFGRQEHICLSTLHSCKGLDFPVVFIYAPKISRRNSYNPEASEKLVRNLFYVGITRAMDHLNIFTCASADSLASDLKKACLSAQ